MLFDMDKVGVENAYKLLVSTVAPRPITGPCTPTTIGWIKPVKADKTERACSMVARRSRAESWAARISSKSPPAENTFPVEVSSTARTSGSPLSRLRTAANR